MTTEPGADKGEGRLHRLGHEVEEELEHVVDGVRRRVRAAELGAMEGSPDPLLAALDSVEGAIDPEHEGERVADQTRPKRRKG